MKKFIKMKSTFWTLLTLIIIINGSSIVLANGFNKIWDYKLDYTDPLNTVQSQPKEYEGKLFFVDGIGNLIALEKNTGQLIYKNFIGNQAGRRGFVIDKDKSQIAIVAGAILYVLDLETGKKLHTIETTSAVAAPIITRDCYIVFGNSGVIQCHNKNLDKITWKNNLGKTARVWSNAIWSNKHNMVYFVTSNPGGLVAENRSNDTYSSSLIGLDASNGLVKFSHQMVKNDLWDFDGVGQPILIENFGTIEGDKYDLVIGLNKTGTVFAVRADTGLPVKKDQFSEKTFSEVSSALVKSKFTQTIPSWPDRVSSIELYKKDLRLDQIKPELLRYAKFGEFITPNVNYDTVTRGLHGGPEWHGGVYFDDIINNKKLLAVPVNNTSWILRVNYIYRSVMLKNLIKIANFVKIYIAKPLINISKKMMSAIGNSDKNDNIIKQKKQDSRWIQALWTGQDFDSKISNYYYKYIDFKYSDKTYKENCASCHRYDRDGRYQSELVGDGYVPSLVGYTLTDKFSYGGNYINFQKLHNSKVDISENELKELFENFDALDKKALEEGKLKKKGLWQSLLGKDSLPLNKSPWGGIAIVDLKSGKLVNHITVGKMKNKNGQIKDSSVIFGGLGAVNKEGRTMITGTVDANAYYVSLPDGKIIDTIKLMRPGSVNPLLTEINGCEAWVFVETGGRFSFYDRNLNGFSVETFVNKNACEK